MPNKTEEQKRRDAFEYAMHSNRLEGLESTPEFKADAELYITDEISIEDLIERTLARHKNSS